MSFENDFRGLKLILRLESGFEVLFGSANAKVHVHAILGLGDQMRMSRDFLSEPC